MVAITGLLFSLFYSLTALATIAYYRRRVMARPMDALLLGILPLAAAVFVAWIIVKSLMNAPGPQRWSMLGIVLAGVAAMFVAQFVLRSPFFQVRREAEAAGQA